VCVCFVLQFGIESRVVPYTAADRPVVRSRPEQVLVLCYSSCIICMHALARSIE